MISLEQVRLLESKVTKTIDYVKKVTEENTRLKEKLDSNQKRIDELEVLIQRFRDEQKQIEDRIVSILDRLNQFEDASEGAAKIHEDAIAAPETPKKDNPVREAKKAAGLVNAPETHREPPSAPEVKTAGPAAQKSVPLTGAELDIF